MRCSPQQGYRGKWIAKLRAKKAVFEGNNPILTKQRFVACVAFCLAGLSRAESPRPVLQQPAMQAVETQELDRDLRDLRYADLEARLKAIPKGTERTYFEGILANRSGDLETSLRLLGEAVPQLRPDERRRKAQGIAALADDYLKLFRYKEAEQTYSVLLNQYSRDIEPAVLEGIRDDFGIIQIIADYPPQTIDRNGSRRLKTVRSPIGTFDAVLTVNGIQSPWILDTGANFSSVTASFAKRLGIKASERTAQTKGGTNGFENRVRAGLLPELTLGGATVRNVVVVIFDDRSLNISTGPNTSYQIQGIVGYPVFQTLGGATFTSDGYFDSDLPKQDAGAFSRMFMNKLTPLVEGSVEGKKLLFAFDTGASSSDFTKRYYDAFPAQFQDLKAASIRSGGAGGAKERRVYRLPQAAIEIGGRKVVLREVPVATSLLGTEIDDSYGNLGRDIATPFASFTVDFARMQFSLGKALSPAATPVTTSTKQ